MKKFLVYFEIVGRNIFLGMSLLFVVSKINDNSGDIFHQIICSLGLPNDVFWALFMSETILGPILEESSRKLVPEGFTFCIIVGEIIVTEMLNLWPTGTWLICLVVIKVVLHGSYYVLQKNKKFKLAVLLHMLCNFASPLYSLGMIKLGALIWYTVFGISMVIVIKHVCVKFKDIKNRKECCGNG